MMWGTQLVKKAGAVSSGGFDWSGPVGRKPCLPAFTGEKVLVPTDNFEPVNYFTLYLNDDLMNHLVVQTNLKAEQFLHSQRHTLKPNSRIRRWVPTTKEELRKFFGLTLLMGLIRKPVIAMYWSQDPLYATPLFGEIMSRNRYQLLLKFLHFNDNEKAPKANDPERDRLYKIRPLLDHMFEKFQEVYDLAQEVAIDESLLLWKGRLLFKQYLPLKRSRFGVKLYKLCESCTGYTYRFQVYAGKDSSFAIPAQAVQPGVDLSATEKIVWYLMMPLLNKGHRLCVDNFYTSLQLFDQLHKNGTPACGTIRSSRKGFPKQLVSKKQKPGESSVLRSRHMLAVKFTDKKDIYMLSTIHDNSCETVAVRRKSVSEMEKPKCIIDYNTYMGGVDISDQLLEPYDATRKTMAWYKKLALYLFQLALLNGHILYKQSCTDPKLSLLEFTHDVVSDLLFGDADVDEDEAKSECVLRMTGRHFPSVIQPEPGAAKARPTRRCRVCYKKQKRSESRYCCTRCPSKPGLCVDTCFELYHSKIKYWK